MSFLCKPLCANCSECYTSASTRCAHIKHLVPRWQQHLEASLSGTNRGVSALSSQPAQLPHSSAFSSLLLQGTADPTLAVGVHSVRTAPTGQEYWRRKLAGKILPRMDWCEGVCSKTLATPRWEQWEGKSSSHFHKMPNKLCCWGLFSTAAGTV